MPAVETAQLLPSPAYIFVMTVSIGLQALIYKSPSSRHETTLGHCASTLVPTDWKSH